MSSRLDAADLIDLVAQSAADEAERDAAGEGFSQGRPGKRQRIYADHRPLSAIEAGIKRGDLHQVCSQHCACIAGFMTLLNHPAKPTASHTHTHRCFIEDLLKHLIGRTSYVMHFRANPILE